MRNADSRRFKGRSTGGSLTLACREQHGACLQQAEVISPNSPRNDPLKAAPSHPIAYLHKDAQLSAVGEKFMYTVYEKGLFGQGDQLK